MNMENRFLDRGSKIFSKSIALSDCVRAERNV
jgi:hypothetical protein